MGEPEMSCAERVKHSEIESVLKVVKIFEDCNDLILCYNPDIEIIYASSLALRLFKLKDDQDKEGIVVFQDTFGTITADWNAIISTVFSTGEMTKFVLQMPDSNWYSWRIVRKLDLTLAQQVVLCFGVNISEKVSDGLKLKFALEHEQEFNTLISRFVSSAAYELRAELAHINMTSDLIERFYKSWTQVKVSEHLDKIKKSVDSLNYMIGKVLVLNGTGLGTITFNPEIIDLSQVVQECIDSSKLYNTCHLSFDYKYNSVRKNFVLDRLQLRFVIVNLIMLINKYSDLKGKCIIKVDFCRNLLSVTFSGDMLNISRQDIEYMADFFSRPVEEREIQPVWNNRAVIKYAIDAHKAGIEIKEAGSNIAISLNIPVGEPY
jgi:signal transduction histidine kinase